MLITPTSTLLLLLAGFYVLWISRLYWGLAKLKVHANDWNPSVSVIIPARNESENIEPCIESVMDQTYPAELFQVIVVDDRSEDNTADIVTKLLKIYPNLKLIRLNPLTPSGVSPKKEAIQTGIDHSDGEIILTTDADCTVQSTWISTVIGQFEAETGVVCGWVRLKENAGLFSRLQSIEAFGLVAAGAGSIGLGIPLIANGANLAYRRSVFEQVGGFEDINHLASGDDDLLMQKIHRETTWKVGFAPQKDSVIKATPASNIGEFFHQRLRWASKGMQYKNISMVLFLVMIYIYFIFLLLGIPLCLIFKLPCIVFVIPLLVKILSDYVLISRALKLIREKVKAVEFIVAELGQIVYVVLVGPLSLTRRFEWKGRKYSK